MDFSYNSMSNKMFTFNSFLDKNKKITILFKKNFNLVSNMKIDVPILFKIEYEWRRIESQFYLFK